jgi:predicted transcriptional regulator
VELSQALVEDAAFQRVLQKLQVSDAMATDYLTLPADSDVGEAGLLLVASGARCVVVVDADSMVVGILTHEGVQQALRGNSAKTVTAAKACEQDGCAARPADDSPVLPRCPLSCACFERRA